MKTYIQKTVSQQTNMPLVLHISKAKTPHFPFYAPKHTQDIWIKFQYKLFKLECKTVKGRWHSQLGTVYTPDTMLAPIMNNEMIIFSAI